MREREREKESERERQREREKDRETPGARYNLKGRLPASYFFQLQPNS
jgi:hypothetical protein